MLTTDIAWYKENNYLKRKSKILKFSSFLGSILHGPYFLYFVPTLSKSKPFLVLYYVSGPGSCIPLRTGVRVSNSPVIQKIAKIGKS